MFASTYIWAKVIGHLEKTLSDATVSEWLGDAELIELTHDRLILYAPQESRQEIIRKRCAPYIQEALEELFQLRADLVVWGDDELDAYRQMHKGDASASFDPQLSFESYVTTPANQTAVKIAQAAANDPGSELYNPLLIYGPAGTGKTHLLYAIANRIKAVHPGKKVVYIHGDQFANELVNAARNGTIAAFNHKYRQDLDVLLIDDIQFFAGKEVIQEVFYYLFTYLYEHKKQIVMTADRVPGDIAAFADWLRGTLDSVIKVGLSPLDRET